MGPLGNKIAQAQLREGHPDGMYLFPFGISAVFRFAKQHVARVNVDARMKRCRVKIHGNIARPAEAQRNRCRVVEVATKMFASADAQLALEAVAREARVGIGALYCHLPTRERHVETVYRDQLDATTRDLLRQHPPAAALRLWTDAFLDWAVTKHGIVDALRTVVSSGRIASNEIGDKVQIVGTTLVVLRLS
jgi:hypothetical protein